MRSNDIRRRVRQHLARHGHLTLFLDYDGTLVPIAPTPDEALPDGDLLELLSILAVHPAVRPVILSGRPLDVLPRLLPIDGLIFAGLYGAEVRMGDHMLLRGEPSHDGSRDTLNQLKDRWVKLAEGLSGFLVEDKGRALALHARWADADQATQVIAAARDLATDLSDVHAFRIIDGDRFLEIAPLSADKGEFVDWLLTYYPVERDLPVAFGDDNKDDAAFAEVRKHGGLSVGVDHRYPLPDADVHIESYHVAREWLRSFLAAPEGGSIP